MEENRPEELQAEEEKEAGLSEGADDKAAWKNKARPAIYAMAGFYDNGYFLHLVCSHRGRGNSLWSAGRIQKFKKEIKKFLTEIHDESIISTY